MVAERPVRLVELDGEDLAAKQLVERRGAASPVEEAVAQRAGEPAEDARLDEELAQVVGQVRHDVPGEVLPDEAAARTDGRQDPAALVGRLAAGREVEELEAGRPALRPAGEDREIVRRDRVAVVVAEEPLDLPRPGTAGRPGRSRAARPDTRRRDRLKPGATRDPTRIASQGGAYSTKRPSARSAGVSSSAWASSTTRTARPPVQRSSAAAASSTPLPAAGEGRQGRRQGRVEVADHRRLVGVPGLRAIPRDRHVRGGREAGEEGRLAGSGRRDDDAEAALPDGLEQRLEPIATEGGGRRNPDLRGHDRRPGTVELIGGNGRSIGVHCVGQYLDPTRRRPS